MGCCSVCGSKAKISLGIKKRFTMLSVNFIMSQIMGLLATLILCSSYVVKNKEKFLFLGIVGDLVYGLSFVFVNSIGTGIITILSCIQFFDFYQLKTLNFHMWNLMILLHFVHYYKIIPIL